METVVEIDENERYWVGGGFGRRGLLPNDRGSFTTTDGSMSWKTLSDASEDLVLLGRGWSYEGNEFLISSEWMYAKDFRTDSIENAKPDRGMMHWVRFRRLYRTKLFNPDEFVSPSVSEKCDDVDSSATDALGQLLMDTLTYCTLLHNPTTYTDAMAFPLKERIINIAIRQQVQAQIHQPPNNGKSTTTPNANANANNNNNNISTDAFYQLDQLRIKLETFVEQESAKTIMHRLLASVDFPFDKRSGHDLFDRRKKIVANRCFPSKECEAITTLIVKNLDPNFQLHCDQPNCGESCRFFKVQCPNDGCPTRMSRMYLNEHNEQCSYAIIECECGDRFPRHQLAIHNSQVCKIREVECPFINIGCGVKVRACDLQSHLDEDTGKHLLLSVSRLAEHQNVIKDLNGRVIILEGENKELKQSLENHVKKSTKDISQLDAKLNKTSKNLSNHEATCNKEFRKISSENK